MPFGKLAWISEAFKPVKFMPGQVIIGYKQDLDGIYVVHEGTISISDCED